MNRFIYFLFAGVFFAIIFPFNSFCQKSNTSFHNESVLADSSGSKILGTVIASFTAPDQVCTNTPIQIVNTSKNVTSYYWNFCEANAAAIPEGVDLGNPGSLLNGPVFVDMTQDNNGNYFVFAINNISGNITRMNFGNSLLNTPIVDDLGNFGGNIPKNTEGVQIINVNGNWLVILAGGDPVSGNPSSIAKINFGGSLASLTPVAVNWGNIGGLDYPLDLFIFNEANNWYGYTVNSRNNTISRINFGSDFSSIPTGTNLGNLGNLNIPTGLGAINSAGNWFLFFANDGDGTLTRLNFGNSLLNTPTAQNIGNPNGTLNLPRDISFIQFCDKIEGFVVNAGNNQITRIDFGNDMMSSPTATSLGNIGNLNFPHSISKLFRVGNDIYSFIPNVNSSSITRLRLVGCTVPGSSLETPPPIVYSQPGTYDINLQVDIGLPSQTSFCKQIVVTDCSVGTCDNWLNLPAYNSYISVGDLDIPGNQITIEANINLTQAYPGGPTLGSDIVAKYANPVDVNYLLRAQNAQITTTSGFFQTPETCPLQINKTYHIAMVYDGNSLKFYRNGFLMNEVPATGNLIQNDWLTQIGFYQYAFYNTNFIGYINEVKIWNVARTQLQLQANMTTPLPSPSTQTGLLAYYSFNDLINKQGNAIWNGTLNGSALINQVNPQCPFAIDNDCCPAITGIFVGNTVCPDQLGMLTFHPISNTLNPPYSLQYSNGGTSFTQDNVLDGIAFEPSVLPAITTQYQLIKITDANNCASDISDVTATITVLVPVQLLVTPDTSICINSSAQLFVSGGTQFLWSPSAFLNNPNVDNPIATPVQTTRFYVSGKDVNNCNVQDSVTVRLLPKPVFNAPDDEAICVGKSVILSSNNNPNDSYSWSPAAGLNSPTAAAPVATPDLTTTYHLTITDAVCNQFDSAFDVQVVVHAIPIVTAGKSNDIDCSTFSSKLSASGASSYSWLPITGLNDPSSPNPTATVTSTTKFVVQGANAEGCFAYDSITVKVSQTGANAFAVANAFTPNGDNVNDCFGIRSWGAVTIQEFSIFNRWGQKIFETKNPSACWDGTLHGEQQQSGGFVYIIKASTFCGTIQKTGTVLLIR